MNDMNLITAITLAITIAWLQSNASAGALVDSRRGQFHSDATHSDATATGKGERQLLFEKEIRDGYMSSAKVIRLEPNHAVFPTSSPHRESTTTARPSHGQIPRPAMVSRQGSSVWI